MMSNEFLFILLVLATWRITHLLNKEDGPFDIVFLLRRRAGNSFWGTLLDCFYCVSVWVALPLGLAEGDNWWQKLLFWWALSGAACLLEQATTMKFYTKNKDNSTPDFKED